MLKIVLVLFAVFLVINSSRKRRKRTEVEVLLMDTDLFDEMKTFVDFIEIYNITKTQTSHGPTENHSAYQVIPNSTDLLPILVEWQRDGSQVLVSAGMEMAVNGSPWACRLQCFRRFMPLVALAEYEETELVVPETRSVGKLRTTD